MSLSPLSRRIALSALRLNGTKILWQKAIFCPGKRKDGTPCYDEESGSSYGLCKVCQGNGAIYKKGELIYGVYTDNSNQYQVDPSGGFMMGEKTLSLPYWLPISLLKQRSGEGDFGRRLLRDRFTLISPQGKPTEILYLKQDPTKPTIGSETIYQIATVSNND